MGGRRRRILLGTVLGTALAALPVATVVVLYFHSVRSSGPDRAEARSLFEARGREVAAAWAAWAAPPDSARHTGFVPLQELTLPPAGIPQVWHGRPIDSYVRRVELPTQRPAPRLVHFPDGSAMTVPLVPADQAFSALVSVECAQGTMKSSGAPCFSAAVTAARLGEVQVQTGRGLAAVPAWLFTVSELPRPVARVAVAPEAIGSSPAPTLPPANSRLDSVMASPFRLDEVEGNTVRFWFIPEYAPTVGPVAYETADVVVLGVQAERPYGWGGIPEREPELITVMLSKPVGSRLLLGIDGKPIPQSGRIPTTPAIRPT